MSASDLQMIYAAFHKWFMSEGEDNRHDIIRIKKMLPIALKECITEKERTYIMHYFIDGMTIYQIADMCGVHKSTVSRTIRRGLNRLYKHLRFTSESFANVIKPIPDIRTRRIKDDKTDSISHI